MGGQCENSRVGNLATISLNRGTIALLHLIEAFNEKVATAGSGSSHKYVYVKRSSHSILRYSYKIWTHPYGGAYAFCRQIRPLP